MMKIYTTFLLCCLFFILTATPSKADRVNDKIDNLLKISQKYADDGEYKKALEWNDKAIEIAKKRDSALIDLLYYRAKYQLVLSNLQEFEETTAAFLEISKKRKNASFGYAYNLLRASSLYLEYSDVVTAQGMYQKAIEILDNDPKLVKLAERGKDDDLLRAKVKTELYLSLGYYDSAQTSLTHYQLTAEEFYKSSGQTIYQSRSNKHQDVKFSSREKKRLKREYAFSKTLEGKLYRLIGNYNMADSVLLSTETWIETNIRKDDESYISNFHERTLNIIESKIDPILPKKMLEKNIYRAERVLGISHQLYFKIQEDLVDYYAWQRFHFKGEKTQWDFDTNTSLYFGKNSIQQACSNRLAAKDDYLRGNFERAGKILEEVFNEGQLPKNHKEYILANQLLYKVALALEEEGVAQKALDNYVLHTEKNYGKESLAYHIAKVDEATYLTMHSDKFEKADELFTEHLPVIKERLSPHHYKRLQAEKERANYYALMGDTQKAAELSASIKKAYADYYGTDHLEYINGLQGTAAFAIDLGEYADADAQITEMLNLYDSHTYRKGTQNVVHATALETAARFQVLTGQYDIASQNLSKANRLSKNSPDKVASSSFDDTQAQIYLKKEYFSNAERIINKSIEHRTARFGDHSRLLIVPYTQLARLSYLKGDYIKADSIAQSAHEISIEIFGEDTKQDIEPLEVKAEIAIAMGNYELAQEYTQKKLEITKKVYGERHTEVAKGYTNLALIGLYMGYPAEEVMHLFKDAVNIVAIQLGKDNPVFAITLKNLALAKIEVGEYAEAEDLLKEANKIWIDKLKTENNTNTAEITLLLGDLEMKREFYGQAEDHYNLSQKIYSKIFTKDHPLYVKSTLKRSQAYYAAGSYNKALKYASIALDQNEIFIREYFPTLSAKEKAKYWKSIQNDYNYFYSLTNTYQKKKLYGKMYDYALQTKPLLLSSSVKIRTQIQNSGDSTLIKDFENWVEKKELLTKVFAMSIEQRLEEGINIKNLEKEINVLEKELSARSSVFNNRISERISWKDIQKNLADGEAAVEIVRFRNFTNVFTDSVMYAALILTPKTKTAPVFKIIPNGNMIETEGLGYYKTNLIFGFPDEESYAAFWKPINEVVGDGTKVYFSSDGVYNQINLESIPVNLDKGTYIIDQNNIVLTSSTAEILSEQEDKKDNMNVSLFGNPVFYKDLTPDQYNQYTVRPITQLPGTYKEVKALDKLLSSKDHTNDQVFLNKDATETAVKGLTSPRVFHIATHGFFLDDLESNNTKSLFNTQQDINPLLRSGLLLTNAGDLMDTDNVYAFNKEEGVLTAYEAMNLNFDETELVVLSACETGKGDNKVGEGVYGLQRAFLVAGADNIIMSLFEVSDEATQKLMISFYQLWLKEGHNKRDAFALAKKQLREEYPEPKYWGAFIMIGKI
ncbi:CHAT domain-containing protein [Flammeovirga sp. MY04]|uniref:CHAT domain-containing protein n=1 Tax=Flammeovirga sp. MY04 TaxID=1191459 RepID=UPI000824AF58|nr:CHAT domain-containing protein [Flammeovirga sp. MY04]ANQ47674.2 CHAT domain-containing protein [Flammeovirga sp. MY04]